MNRLLVFGLGYSGRAVADLAVGAGWGVVGTSRTVEVAPDSLEGERQDSPGPRPYAPPPLEGGGWGEG